MAFLMAISAMIMANGGNVLSKKNFKETKVSWNDHIFWVFIIFTTLSGFVNHFYWWNYWTIDGEYIFMMFAFILVSMLMNISQFEWIKKTTIQEREPIISLTPLITIIIAFAIFPSEREIKYVIAIVLAMIVVYYFNIKWKSWLKINFKHIVNWWIFWVILEALSKWVLMNFYKYWTWNISAEFMVFSRSFWMLVIMILIWMVTRETIKTKWKNLWMFAWWLYFLWHFINLHIIENVGVIFTVMLWLLWPVVSYSFSYLFLKEKIEKKNVISSFLIISIILITVFV